ncbi:MAG: M20 family metallopeptidase [Deltaproteobacteria bacterium]|nr:M20 family metallopeptidase [Deltaproteobacteria bacterium]
MSTDKKAIRAAVAARVEQARDDLVRITQELVRIPSVNPPGDYARMAEAMFENYRAEGLEPMVVEAPREEIEALGLTVPRPNVVARVRGKGSGPVFCLDAHMDVVGTGNESAWSHPPFGGELHEGRIYGRGAEDTKAHLAVQLIVYRALREAGVELQGDLLLTSTVDDEIGQWPGMGYLIERGFKENGFPRPDYHIAGEPTGIDTVGCLARGRLWYEYVLKGRPAHGGNPAEGINAVDRAIDLANAVRRFEIHEDPLMGATTVNLGILQGGEAVNVVPERCRITFDIRPARKKEVVKAFMDRTVQELQARDPDFVVESMRLLNDRQTGGIGPDHPFVKTVQDVVGELTGKSVVPTGNMAGYSSLGNAYWTSMNGVAGIMYGGGDFSRAHTVDEYVTADELVETAQVFAGLVIELCA